MAIQVQENVPLASYTIYKIGGPARFFVEVRSVDELKEALGVAVRRGLPFFILGAGSNILIHDQGFPGLLIRLTGGSVRVEGEYVYADAAARMARGVTESARAGLTGFEWGIGVPGSVGGSVRGNAGCFGGEIKDIVERVRVLSAANQEERELTNSECEFAYRDSMFKKNPQWIILSATLRLRHGDPAAIQSAIQRITRERVAEQDIGTQSCGCIFKNISWDRTEEGREALLLRFPELARFKMRSAIPASFLIDQAGLKGRRIGAALISPRHANFFVNEGGARAADVAALIRQAKDGVRDRYGLELEEEIQYVGF